MSRVATDDLYEEGQVVVVSGRPALITGVDGSQVHFKFVSSDGLLGTGGHFKSYDEGVKHIDFAKIVTRVELPPEWESAAIEYDKPKKSVLDDWEPESHPAYGTVHVGRVSGHTQLFMSPFKHQNYMSLSIQRTTKHRSLAEDRTFSSHELIQINMSEAQWARMVSSAGMGAGTPCTINHVAGKMMPACPQQQDIEKFHKDTERYAEKAAEALDAAIATMQSLLDKPSVTKAERRAVLDKLTSARLSLTSGLPHVVSMLRERMEHVVSEGKTELESFFQRTASRMGLTAAQSPLEMPLLPPAKEEDK